MSLEVALNRALFRYTARNYAAARAHYERSGRAEYLLRSLALFDKLSRISPL